MGVRFQVLTAANKKLRVFWDVAQCSHVEVDRRFRGEYCLHQQTLLPSGIQCRENLKSHR
jgi:hypothetical protein